MRVIVILLNQQCLMTNHFACSASPGNFNDFANLKATLFSTAYSDLSDAIL